MVQCSSAESSDVQDDTSRDNKTRTTRRYSTGSSKNKSANDDDVDIASQKKSSIQNLKKCCFGARLLERSPVVLRDDKGFKVAEKEGSALKHAAKRLRDNSQYRGE